VHTIGIGTEQPVPIPVPGVDGITEYLMDEEGNQLTTRFNESTLRMVASMTQGSFFRSSTGHELAASLSEVIRHEQEQIGWKRTEGYRDLYGPLLLIASVATFFIFLKA
jgi:hypothetical protein